MNGKDWKMFGALWVSILITIAVFLVILHLINH